MRIRHCKNILGRMVTKKIMVSTRQGKHTYFSLSLSLFLADTLNCIIFGVLCPTDMACVSEL